MMMKNIINKIIMICKNTKVIPQAKIYFFHLPNICNIGNNRVLVINRLMHRIPPQMQKSA